MVPIGPFNWIIQLNHSIKLFEFSLTPKFTIFVTGCDLQPVNYAETVSTRLN